MASALGLQCTVSIGGSTAIGALRGTGGALTFAVRKIIAGSTSTPLQGLIGYAVSTGARSALQVDFKLPYSGTSILSTALGASGVTVGALFGAAGGVQLATAYCESLQVTGSEGGDLECTATFQSTSFPTTTSGGSPNSADYFKFNDVTSCSGPGVSTNDLNSFTWRVTRTLAAYRGNSAYGIPKYLKIADTECLMDLEYLKTSEGAGSTVISPPLSVTDASVILTGMPLISGGDSGSLTLTCRNAFLDAYPTVNGNLEDFVTERASFRSSTGQYTIG